MAAAGGAFAIPASVRAVRPEIGVRSLKVHLRVPLRLKGSFKSSFEGSCKGSSKGSFKASFEGSFEGTLKSYELLDKRRCPLCSLCALSHLGCDTQCRRVWASQTLRSTLNPKP